MDGRPQKAPAPLPGPGPASGVAGSFAYRLDGEPARQIRVRGCPDPARAVAMLEELLETPVVWLERRSS